MKLEKLIIENFRGYQGRVEITLNDLTALIGKNDVGKTTVLDALGVFSLVIGFANMILLTNAFILMKMMMSKLGVFFLEPQRD
jgi:AAA15 family ATPase/GTPase